MGCLTFTARAMEAWGAWWTDELTMAKKELASLRRRWKRSGTTEDGARYWAARNGYLGLIRDSKNAKWRAFSSGLNKDVWGHAFKWATNMTREQEDL